MSSTEKNTSRLLPKKKPCDMPCPKCGSLDIYRQSCSKGAKLDKLTGDWDERESKYAFVDRWQITVKRDCIMHHCRCCQHDWETEPLNR